MSLLNKMKQKNKNNKIIEEQQETIEWLKKLCKMAEVPQILIDNTNFFSGKVTEEDMVWARKIISNLNEGDFV